VGFSFSVLAPPKRVAKRGHFLLKRNVHDQKTIINFCFVLFYINFATKTKRKYMDITLNKIEEGLEDLRNGKVLIVVDDENRENEGDFIVAGEKVTPEIVNFMVTHGRGLLCAVLSKERCKDLDLNPMAENNTSLMDTPFTMSVDLRGHGCTTGISIHDRTATIKALVAGVIKPEELARPGHIFPLYAADNGVLERDGHTEAVYDLTRLAGLLPGGALIEIMNADGTMARLPQLKEIAVEHNIKIVSIKDIQAYRKKNNF
jgi:3,4-dihydroxy 2-butanone 4-phosphate synthase